MWMSLPLFPLGFWVSFAVRQPSTRCSILTLSVFGTPVSTSRARQLPIRRGQDALPRRNGPLSAKQARDLGHAWCMAFASFLFLSNRAVSWLSCYRSCQRKRAMLMCWCVLHLLLPFRPAGSRKLEKPYELWLGMSSFIRWIFSCAHARLLPDAVSWRRTKNRTRSRSRIPRACWTCRPSTRLSSCTRFNPISILW